MSHPGLTGFRKGNTNHVGNGCGKKDRKLPFRKKLMMPDEHTAGLDETAASLKFCDATDRR